ncbi:MAG: hypothetical protein IH855_06100 [Bacteroidetes bacterium]|nr:hypothetical protein [Bacteroidota bacterium]
MASRLFLLAALAALPLAALAQDHLPNLTPTVFEITGELEINLPQLERQPLSGFGPPPRTYVIPAERQAATRPYGINYDGLPAFALTTPADPDFALADGRILRAEGGLGTDVARYARFDFANRTLFVDVDYDGLGSTTDVVGNGTPDLFVTFDRLDARGGVRTSGNLSASLTAALNYNDFSLPGGSVVDRRTISMFGAEAEIGTGVSAPTPAGLSLSVAFTNVDDELNTIPTSNSDTRFEADAFAELLNRLVRIEGGLGSGSFIDGSDETDVFDYNAGLILQGYTAGGAQFKGGARILGYSTSLQNGNASSTIFAPVASAELPLGASGRLFAFTDPHVEQRGVFDLLDANPFAEIGFLAPDIHTVDAEAGIELRSGSVGLKVYGGATFSPTRQFFERNAGTRLFNTYYEKARTIVGGADVSYVTTAGIELSAGGALRNGSLTELDQALPYYASMVGRVGAQVPFASGRGRVGLSAYFEGERPADRFETRMIPGFGTLSVDAAYEFTRGLSLVLRGERLVGDAERWEGFPQASTTILGGIRLVR